MHDCRRHFDSFPNTLRELLYADDTLLIGQDASMIQRYMQIVAREGRKYGLRLNNSKLELLHINCDTPVYDEEGKVIKSKDSIKYLGAMLHKTGRIDSEIGINIGIAKQDFRTLIQIWGHANISKKLKLELYWSLIVSKLLYGL